MQIILITIMSSAPSPSQLEQFFKSELLAKPFNQVLAALAKKHAEKNKVEEKEDKHEEGQVKGGSLAVRSEEQKEQPQSSSPIITVAISYTWSIEAEESELQVQNKTKNYQK